MGGIEEMQQAVDKVIRGENTLADCSGDVEGMRFGYKVDSKGRSWGGHDEVDDVGKCEVKENTVNLSEFIDKGYSLRNKKQPQAVETFNEDEIKKLKNRRPRWYNQSYVVFLCLRLSGTPLPRSMLIPRTLHLSEFLSSELGLPQLFGGKTPKNTISGLLTENRDKLFTANFNRTAKKMVFGPSYEPGNFVEALERYESWTKDLIENVWPISFGAKRMPSKVETQYTAKNSPAADATPSVEPPDGVCDIPRESNTPKQTVFIPKSFDDVFEVKESLIQNAGSGLFSKIYIPPKTILGYYFGVPYPEDEFDYLKSNLNQANSFAHKYRLTVLDATDDQGIPFYNHPRVFCPFHFINENILAQNLVFIEGISVNQILCMSIKPIYPGQETYVSYGTDVERPWLNPDTSNVSRQNSCQPPMSLYHYIISLPGTSFFNPDGTFAKKSTTPN